MKVIPIKANKKQLNLLNDKVKNLHPDINVKFTCYDRLRAHYTELIENNNDTYYYQLWNSIIANSINFNEVYYSIT